MALSGLLQEVVGRVTTWVLTPGNDAAMHHLVEVLKDEIAGGPLVELHLPVPKDPALRRLAVSLSEDPSSSRLLSALAREVGVSERSLFRGFQRETGLSPGQWRRQMQVLRSLELLTSGVSVTDTSLEVGYESAGAFIRAFRQVIGMTPSAYAQRQR